MQIARWRQRFKFLYETLFGERVCHAECQMTAVYRVWGGDCHEMSILQQR